MLAEALEKVRGYTFASDARGCVHAVLARQSGTCARVDAAGDAAQITRAAVGQTQRRGAVPHGRVGGGRVPGALRACRCVRACMSA